MSDGEQVPGAALCLVQGFRGRNARDVWMAKLQVHPELASGTSNSPPAGIMLIQQPGRVVVVTLR